MEGLMVFGFFFLGLAILDILALRYGVDTRPGFGDPRRPAATLDA